MKRLIEAGKTLLIAALPGLFFGAILGAIPGYKLYEYTWKDAGFCISCHVHDYASVGWQKSVHGQMTTCHDCHHQPLHAYFKEAYLMIVKPPKFPRDLDHVPYVKKDLCAACHLSSAEDRSTITGPMQFEDVEKIPKVDQSVLHRIHLSKTTDMVLLNNLEITDQEHLEHPEPLKVLPREKGPKRAIVCADCHGGPTNRAHNFSAVDISCVRCHEHNHKTPIVGQFGCRNCHFQEFLAPVVTLHPAYKKK